MRDKFQVNVVFGSSFWLEMFCLKYAFALLLFQFWSGEIVWCTFRIRCHFRNIVFLYAWVGVSRTIYSTKCLKFYRFCSPFSNLVPLYVIGITETQFFAYLQLIRHRLRALNKLLLHFSRIQNSDANANNTNFATVGQDKSYSFEYFRNEHNRFGSSHLFRNPNTNCLRYGLTFLLRFFVSQIFAVARSILDLIWIRLQRVIYRIWINQYSPLISPSKLCKSNAFLRHSNVP